MNRLFRSLIFILIFGFIYYIFVLYTLDSHLHVSDKNRNIEVDTQDFHGRAITPMLNDHDYRPVVKNMKYILLWRFDVNPFHLIRRGQDSFTNNKCKHTNCFVTGNVSYFKNFKNFDAVVFGSSSIGGTKTIPIATYSNRSIKQKYIFASLESSVLHPVTHPRFDNFFNWTWTYRLDSDISWKYITIYDLNNTVIGPSEDMKWPNKLNPTSEHLKRKLRQKSKPVAWFISHCSPYSSYPIISGRAQFFMDFKTEAKTYGWSIDVYGKCERYGRSISSYKKLKRHYFFYLSFENSNNEDYVTENLLTALNNLVVPVVYGGANYTRFLPPGSYLNAKELGSKKLAKLINDAISNISIYYEYFRWRNHFKYVTSERKDICNICAALNNKKMMRQTTVYPKFRSWWNTPKRQRTYEIMLQLFLSSGTLLGVAAKYNFTRAGSSALIEKIKEEAIIPMVLVHQSTVANFDTTDTFESTISFKRTIHSQFLITSPNFNFSTTEYTDNNIMNSYQTTVVPD